MRTVTTLALLLTFSQIPVSFSHGPPNLLEQGCGSIKRNHLSRRQTTASSGEGSSSGSIGGASGAGYSCDASVCKPPSCMCASTKPPGGLSLR